VFDERPVHCYAGRVNSFLLIIDLSRLLCDL